jgi:hypothetical protein
LYDPLAVGALPDVATDDFAAAATEMEPKMLLRQQRQLLSAALGRLYLIDEPEQHLHALMQRKVAPWLAQLVSKGSAQAMITTHSVPFLTAGSERETCWVYVRRPSDGPTRVETLDAPTLGAFSELELDVGWDRGQLLSTIALLLFVDGRSDQAVLEALLGDELRRLGVAVIPMHGQSRAKGILDAEILLRYSTAMVAVWLDRVPQETIAELLAHPDRAAERIGTLPRR